MSKSMNATKTKNILMVCEDIKNVPESFKDEIIKLLSSPDLHKQDITVGVRKNGLKKSGTTLFYYL